MTASLFTALAQVESKLASFNRPAENLPEGASTSLAQTATTEDHGERKLTQVFRDAKTSVRNIFDKVTALRVSDASAPVNEHHAVFLFVFSIMTIIGCCASTTMCVRAARDSNIAMNAVNIRRKYQRNMQLYLLIKEKMMVEKRAARAA